MVAPLIISGVGWGITIAGWILSPMFTKLVNKALPHIKPGKSKDELHELLTHTLPRLALALEAAEGSAHKDLFEKLVRDLKSAFYDLEDVLDEVEYILHEKQLTTQKKIKWNMFVSRDNASSSDQGVNIEPSLIISGSLNSLLKKKVKKIKELLGGAQKTIELANLPCHNRTRPIVTTTYTQKPNTADPVEKVIGRDEDRLRIVKMLHDTGEANASSSGAKCFSVIGICGIPGSGKTTLAQYICESERTAGYFHLVMWIRVSQNFSVDTIYREMFEAASAKECPKFNSLDVLRNELESMLHGKRFLLVLDDVWCNEDVGHQQLPLLVSPFKVGSRGSKILVTSRDANALSDIGPNINTSIIAIPDLGDKVFFELLMYYALGDSRVYDDDQNELAMIGTEIAQKLRGSPLAARIVGAQLRRKQNDIEFWRGVRDSDLLKETLEVLLLSYRYLDENLKRCFAYCSIFPRRHYLDHNDLINMWVAEGFIKTTEAEEKIEVAQSYVDELVSTSFLQKAETIYGKKYLIHDLLHDLAEKVAGRDGFRIMNGWTGEIRQDVRHLFVETVSEGSIIDEIVKLEKLRTLIIHSGQNNTISEKNVEKIFMKLTNLRVLVMKSYSYTGPSYTISFSDCIGNLKHLRYLSFFHHMDYNLSLSGKVAKLYLLQVLHFISCKKLVLSSKKDMANLTNLRILKPVPDIPNIGRMTSLQGLELFRVKKEKGYELQQLKNLNKLQGNLCIEGLELVRSKKEALEAKLSDKERLRLVKLAWGNSSCDLEVQADVLEGLCPPRSLEILEIRDYPGSRCPDWTMGNTNGENYLESLWLNRCRLLVPSPELFIYFVHLREIILTECNWDTLPNNIEHLKCLIVLRIQYCLNMQSLPVLPQSLKRIEFWGCDVAFMRSCETYGDPNWHNIKNIPSVCFEGRQMRTGTQETQTLHWKQYLSAEAVPAKQLRGRQSAYCCCLLYTMVSGGGWGAWPLLSPTSSATVSRCETNHIYMMTREEDGSL